MHEHKHVGDGRRVPWEAVTFAEVVGEALDVFSQAEPQAV